MKILPTRTQKFARYEFKYHLNEAQCIELEDNVSNFMRFDSHTHADIDNRYFVRSLYFDNLNASNYYEKIDGISERRKFRIRTYNTATDGHTPIFLEEKGRHNQRTFKNRIQIQPDHLELVFGDSRRDELLNLYPGIFLIERFVFDSQRRQLFPCVLVDYRRRPYISDFDINFRITFDSHVRAVATDLLYPHDTIGSRKCLAGYTILEIKFARRIPAWFHRIVQAFDMRRISISKFCLGMETSGLAVDLS